MAEGGLDGGRWQPLSGAQARHLGRLRRELALLEHRYGMPSAVELEPLERALRRRSARIDHLTDRLDELIDEIAGLERERQGVMAGMEAIVTRRIDEIRAEHGEAWSPFPIHAYRMWGVLDSGLVGARCRWESPTMRATCSRLTTNPDVPHTDERCGEPSCGVYAMKSAAAALGARRDGERRWAVGLVALGGKVVEHESGYRAAEAHAVAIAVASAGRTLVTDDPDLVGLAFSATTDAVDLFGEPEQRWPDERIIRTLESTERRHTWTSDPDVA